MATVDWEAMATVDGEATATVDGEATEAFLQDKHILGHTTRESKKNGLPQDYVLSQWLQ